MNQQQQRTAEGILFTDQYQLTMAQLYFRAGMAEQPAQFEYFYRRNPDYGGHQAGYGVNAGLAWLLDWMSAAHFCDEDIAYLRDQRHSTGARIFHDDFLHWLRTDGNFDGISLRAVPEGRVVHPNVPLAVIRGPLAMAQILETSLLNHLNYQTLIATKAARIREAGRGRPILEFGLRRGPERGVNAGARAALIGGADFTSNVGISHVLGYPPKGTHAHSMIQAFMALGEGELGAFRAYAELYPDDCLLLVDTIDTLASGVPNAITVFEELRREGYRPAGIRLDSGDLAHLSIQAARMMDDAGFSETAIVLSNELDEQTIWQILTQIEDEASLYGVDADALIGRLVYGVGTRLITSHGQPALDGVYKLVSIEQGEGWTPAMKISESPAKTLNPGNKRVWRIYDRRNKAQADVLSLEHEDPRQWQQVRLHHPSEPNKRRTLNAAEISAIEPLLVDVLVDGREVYDQPSIEAMRAARQADVERLDAGVKRMVNPHIYHVSLTEGLWELKQELIRSAREDASG